jgi:hypothetical protein
MNHLKPQNWKRSNRSEKIENILEALNHSGTAEAEYFKKRSTALHFFGKGNPQPANEDNEWDFVRITYQGKGAPEFSEFRLSLFSLVDGRFFDEHFAERENQCIVDALDSVGIITSRAFVSRGRLKWFVPISIVFYILATSFWLVRGYYSISVIFLCCLLLWVWLLRKQ